jgi:Mg2+/citrate symporter
MDPTKESYSRRYRRKRRIFWAALLVAGVLTTLVPTPNHVHGGAIKMVFMIFLAVALKVLFEWIWDRKQH